jgi:DNA repair exonuclease SbcCD ATPase subunit
MSKPSTALDLARRLCVVHDKDGTVQICNTGKDSCPCDAAGDLDRIPAGAAAQIAALEEKVAKHEQHMAKCEEGVRRVALEREVEALKAQLERARGWEPGGARDALLGEMADLRKQVEELEAQLRTAKRVRELLTELNSRARVTGYRWVKAKTDEAIRALEDL